MTGKILILGFAKPTPFTMEVITDRLLERGACVLSRHKLKAGMMGFVSTQEDSTRIACQVAAQEEAAREDGYFRTHLNVFAGPEFWGLPASPEEAPLPPSPGRAEPVPEESPSEDEAELAVEEIAAFADSARMLRLWLHLSTELESHGVLTRGELVESLRQIARQTPAVV